jgi:hypothetical protein
MSIFKDMLTTKGESFCPVRMMMLCSFTVITVGVLGAFAAQVYAYLHAVHAASPTLPPAPAFDAVGYGSSVSAVAAGGGIGIGLKKSDEPDQP